MIAKTVMIFGAIIWFSFPLLAQEHSHSSSPRDTKVQLDNGKKWETDGPLRQGMEKINALVKANLSAVHSGSLDDEAYKKLGQAMKKQTDFIFKKCKLGPKADHELHKVLIYILSAGKAFLGQDSSISKHDAFVSVLEALRLYGEHFEHRGWIGPK